MGRVELDRSRICSGYTKHWTVVVHALRCPVVMYQGDPSLEVSHGISPECEVAYRIVNGMKPKQAA